MIFPFSQFRRRPGGFTLIELLVVIAIIGILAAILIPTTSSVRISAKRAKTKVQFSQWAAAMEQFRQDYGYYRITGRIDDVINVSGHRIGTAEIESAMVSHPSVAEAAAVGRPDAMKGQALVVFVTLKTGINPTDELKEALRNHVAHEIGSLAKPDQIRFAAGLPKTRSGKIMRRILKDIAAGTEVHGDTSTLEDFSVVANLQSEE